MVEACGDEPGGISGLLELIHEHGEALEADFQREYGIALHESLLDGSLTPGRFRTLVRGLPLDGTAFWRTVRDDRSGPVKPSPPPDSWWTPERDLMATLIDQQALLLWMQSEDGRRNRNRPKPIERPGVSNGRRMGKTSLPQAQVRALLAARGPQRGGDDG